MDCPDRRLPRGQAAPEYVAVVCLVAVVLAAAATLPVGDRSIASAVIRYVRVALCVVGGDVCRSADARAMGLDPCVVRAERFDRRWSATGLWATAFQQHGYAIERRSDGRIAVTASHRRGGGLVGGPGVGIGPVRASAGGEIRLGWRSGMSWTLDGARQLRRFLALAPAPHRLEHDADWRRRGLPAPSARYLAGAGGVSVEAVVEAGAVVPLLEAGGDVALGRRVDPSGTTYFLELPGASASVLGAGLPDSWPGRLGPWHAEMVADASGRARTVRLRSAGTTARPDEEVEVTRVVDLSTAEAAAAYRDLLRPARALAGARALARLGVVQRDVYRVRELPSSPDLELSAVVVGGGHSDARFRRRLVSSTVTTPGGHTGRRADCLDR